MYFIIVREKECFVKVVDGCMDMVIDIVEDMGCYVVKEEVLGFCYGIVDGGRVNYGECDE